MNELLLSEILTNEYGLPLHIELDKMEGYESINYKVKSSSGTYVAKVYLLDQSTIERVEAENRILLALEHHSPGIPASVKSLNGSGLLILEKQGVFLRVLTYVEGTMLAQTVHTPKLIKSFGRFLSSLDRDLLSTGDAYIASTKTAWDLDNLLLNESYISCIDDPSDRKIVAYYFLQWKTHVQKRLPGLRWSIIHNDANDWNVLTQNERVTGLIDFGDMVYSKLIYEVAIAAAYLGLNKEDPVDAISTMVNAYHQNLALEIEEIDVLYYLIAARLCTSVIQSAKTKKEKPDNTYITVSEDGAWQMLKKWLTIHPLSATNEWRVAIGASPISEENDLINRRQSVIPSVLSLSYNRPIHMTGAAFQYMYDGENRTILDAYNNIIHVGHCHPVVVGAAQKAMATLNTNTRYLYRSLTDYATQLLVHFPPHLNKVFLVNSGSAASDLAIRIAKTYTQSERIVVLEHGYHGNTSMGINISHYKYGHRGGTGKKGQIIQAPLPDTYRGTYRSEGAGPLYAQDLIQALEAEGGAGVAAFIAEPIVGCGGQISLATGYLAEVYRYMKSIGGLCISDEVQVGFGRLGRYFWGFEMHDVVPDIVVLGKPIGNGHPMAAVVTTDEIADAFDNGMEFFSSFGGNPVSCAIGSAVLQVIDEEDLQSNAREVGDYLKSCLDLLSTDYPCIGDIRGEGLFLGIDIIDTSDIALRQPDGELAKVIINKLRENGILTSLDGPDNNVIKVKPPLCFNRENASVLVDELAQVLSQMKS